ncbi:hypothetical protein JRI60_43945 [Archangium violaceum]|uniref:hypothetical protein n=1 Tax=Archangium violaceum TaxID=83451 RepID=UPI00194ED893|nr:hypothetical protein [Archangium violaceum]QRN95925.1 hypothetical protein JRI60_43945 [Archangium violaceum]
MRINSVVAALIAGLALAVTGCGVESESESENPQAPVSESEAAPADGQVTAMAICPLKWTCNWVRYYSTQSACTTACGATPCFTDYACTGSCVCP